MDHLIAKGLREQIPFVDGDPCGRTGARDEHRRNDTRVVQVPVPLRNLRFPTRALALPTGSRDLVDISVIPKLHDIIDASGSVAVVVVVRLPEGPKRIDRCLVVVAEVMAKDLHVAQVLVAAKDHPLSIRLA